MRNYSEIKIEEWRDIPEYNGKYQASVNGEIRRVYANGKTRILTGHMKTTMKGSNRIVVKLTKDGKSKELILMQLIASTFLKNPGENMVLYHVDGCQRNNSLVNLAYKSRQELGKLTGPKSRRKPVVKINTDGEDVEYYSSAREAGRKNYMSGQTITDRCNGNVKRGPAPDGYEYAWDDSPESRRAAIKRIGGKKHGKSITDSERCVETR